MAGNFFTGATNGRPVVTNVANGSTRFNTTSSQYEVFDGANWITLGSGRLLTFTEMVEQVEDEIAVRIEADYSDNTTIQDAFAEWEKANEKFKVILALAEKK